MGKQKFYTLQEVANLLKVSERSMYRYIADGRLTATKIGHWKISEKDLEKFVRKSTKRK